MRGLISYVGNPYPLFAMATQSHLSTQPCLYFCIVSCFDVLMQYIMQLLKVNIFASPYKCILAVTEQFNIKIITCWVVINPYTSTMLQSSDLELQAIAAICRADEHE